MNKERNFWRVKMYPEGDTAWGDKYIPWILENKGFIGMGKWKGSEAQNEDFVKHMKVGDIVGVMILDRLLALVQITDVAIELPSERIEGGDSWGYRIFGETDNLSWLVYRRAVRVLDWNIGGLREPIPATSTKTVVRCSDLDATSNKAIVDWFNQVYDSYELRGLGQTWIDK